MKIIIIYLIVLTYSVIGLSQTKNDVVNFKKINTKLLDSLVFEEVMKERSKLNIDRIVHDNICGKAAKYQSEYSSYYDTISHVNNKRYKGNILVNPKDRFEFFLKQSKNKLNYDSNIEVITQFKKVSSRNYSCIKTGTYQEYAKIIVRNYMSSRPHRYAILYSNENFGTVHGEFKTEYNSETDCLTNTGFIAFVYEGYKLDKSDLENLFK